MKERKAKRVKEGIEGEETLKVEEDIEMFRKAMRVKEGNEGGGRE